MDVLWRPHAIKKLKKTNVIHQKYRCLENVIEDIIQFKTVAYKFKNLKLQTRNIGRLEHKGRPLSGRPM